MSDDLADCREDKRGALTALRDCQTENERLREALREVNELIPRRPARAQEVIRRALGDTDHE